MEIRILNMLMKKVIWVLRKLNIVAIVIRTQMIVTKMMTKFLSIANRVNQTLTLTQVIRTVIKTLR